MSVAEYGTIEFARSETRRSARIRDGWETRCGHTIDRTEPYRYTVYKMTGEPELVQLVDCEFCARADNAY